MIDFLLPQSDVWVAAFDRQQVHPTVVLHFAEQVRAKGILLAPWVRTELLARTRDGRQFARLQAVMDGFPDLKVDASIQRDAARHMVAARMSGPLVPTILQAQGWALAERLGARLWSRDHRWLRLAAIGCPVVDRP